MNIATTLSSPTMYDPIDYTVAIDPAFDQRFHRYSGRFTEDDAVRITTRKPGRDPRIINAATVTEIIDQLSSLQQALKELNYDLEAIPAAAHLAEDAEAQAEGIAEVIVTLEREVRPAHPRVIWSVE